MTATVLAVRFVLELTALAALGSWGFQRQAGALVKLGLGAAIRPGSFAWSFALVVVVNAALLHVVGEA